MTKEEVINAVKKFSEKPQVPQVIDVKNCNEEARNYLYAIDQRRIRRRLNSGEKFILSRFYEGYKPKRIAQMMGVSEESIRSRLRKRDVFGKNNKPGRPKSSDLESATQSYSPSSQYASSHSIPAEIVS